jgi:hypothetical protein
MELDRNIGKPMINRIIFFFLICGLCFQTQATEKDSPSESLKAFIGLSGGNSMIARDGTLWMSIKGGVRVHPRIQTGLFVSTIVSDVKNPYKKATSQYIDYNALGAFAEFRLLEINLFSLSIPFSVGGGLINIMEQNVEHSSAEDGFFMGEAGLSFNYQLTRVLNVSIGGGYRLFLHVDNNKLDNNDFNSLYGELTFRWTE